MNTKENDTRLEGRIIGLTKIIFSQYAHLFEAPDLHKLIACKSVSIGDTNSFNPAKGAYTLTEENILSTDMFLETSLEEAAHLVHAYLNCGMEHRMSYLANNMLSQKIDSKERNKIFAERTRTMSMLEFIAMLAVLSFLNDDQAQIAMGKTAGKELSLVAKAMKLKGNHILHKCLETEVEQDLDVHNLPYYEAYGYLWRYWQIKQSSELAKLTRLTPDEVRAHIWSVVGETHAQRVYSSFNRELLDLTNTGFWMVSYMGRS